MLKLTDLRKTTRKAGERRVVYPQFLRDRSLAPRIELAIRYLESMVGRPRRDLEPEAVLRLFGDHKIARCIVSCLATSYQHRPRAFAEELTSGRSLGRALAGFLAVFWGSRVLLQLFYYDRNLRRQNRLFDVLFLIGDGFLASVFALAALLPGPGITHLLFLGKRSMANDLFQDIGIPTSHFACSFDAMLGLAILDQGVCQLAQG